MTAIAIDGPSGAGKSTLARRLASWLGYIYVDTGAMYRTVGLCAVKNGVDPKNSEAVAALLSNMKISLAYQDGAQHVYLNGEDVSGQIRTEEISMAASDVSSIGAVRAFLLDTQRNMAVSNNVLMDGRDIGTVILPHAKIKIFLTASPEERARRRYEELVARGEEASYENVLADVRRRDEQDSSRALAPLKPAPDAVVVDTTGCAFDESFERLKQIIQERL